MPFAAGQTYLFPLDGSEPFAHLWIVATDPDENGIFATVSFTSLRGAKDQTVVLLKREHGFLKWDTCVHYGLAELSNTERLQKHLDRGAAKLHKPLTVELLRLIVDGFNASEFTKRRVREYVQGRKIIARQQSA